MGAEFAPNLTPDRSQLPHRISPGLRRLGPVLVIARGPAGSATGAGVRAACTPEFRAHSLIPPPRANLVRDFGVFAPNARVRPARRARASSPAAKRGSSSLLAPEPVRPRRPRHPI